MLPLSVDYYYFPINFVVTLYSLKHCGVPVNGFSLAFLCVLYIIILIMQIECMDNYTPFVACCFKAEGYFLDNCSKINNTLNFAQLYSYNAILSPLLLPLQVVAWTKRYNSKYTRVMCDIVAASKGFGAGIIVIQNAKMG